jgi:hypothetical protein
MSTAHRSVVTVGLHALRSDRKPDAHEEGGSRFRISLYRSQNGWMNIISAKHTMKVGRTENFRTLVSSFE